MRVALPVWNGRVSPVFDVAEHVCVLDVKDSAATHRTEHRIEDQSRVATLWGLGVDVVVCGAISRELEAALWVAGIEVVAEICGPVDRVIDAFLRGVLAEGAYFSPCHSHRSTEFPRRNKKTRVREGSAEGEKSPQP